MLRYYGSRRGEKKIDMDEIGKYSILYEPLYNGVLSIITKKKT